MEKFETFEDITLMGFNSPSGCRFTSRIVRRAHVCLIGIRWGSMGEGSTVGPTLVDPCPRASRAEGADGTVN